MSKRFFFNFKITGKNYLKCDEGFFSKQTEHRDSLIKSLYYRGRNFKKSSVQNCLYLNILIMIFEI